MSMPLLEFLLFGVQLKLDSNNFFFQFKKHNYTTLIEKSIEFFFLKQWYLLGCSK